MTFLIPYPSNEKYMTNTLRYCDLRIKSVLCLLILIFTAFIPLVAQTKGHSTGANSLLSLSKNKLGDFTWMNEPKHYAFSEGQLTITVDEGTDFFVNPEDETSIATAPYLYREVQGDFVAVARVEPNFDAVWNACSLLLHIDESNWIKFAFEYSDATGTSIVSVVTRGVSDDANGPIIDYQPSIWLKLIRKGSIYAMHWSIDGENYNLGRLAAMPFKEIVKIGMEAQCPSEGPAEHVFSHFSLESKTVKDLRKGL